MSVRFELPTEIEQVLRQELGGLDRAAKEALLVESYRQAKLTRHQLSEALGLSRAETDALLKRLEVFHDLSAADVARESEGLRQLRGGHADRR